MKCSYRKSIEAKLSRITIIAMAYRWARYGILYLLFINDYRKFKKLTYAFGSRFLLNWGDRYPCLWDKTSITFFDNHYIYHTAWAARTLAKIKPALHIDISSSLYFCSIVSAFIPVKFYDYRPANLCLNNLSVGSADLLCLPFENASINSLSCMHVIEHIGLGRYGDPLDPDGDLKAICELVRVLSPGGNLLFVVPVGGVSKVMFNAHRIYSYEQVVKKFHDLELELVEFALIPDKPEISGLILNASIELINQCNYACGCFWFRKCTK
jgi:hypothetical protein